MTDRSLARMLERAEASANAAFVDARARAEPAVGATWIEVAGAHAMFVGVGSPLTQTFGAGLFDPFDSSAFELIEAFYDERGASTSHEISSMASDDTTRLLPSRGYRATESSTVFVRPTTEPTGARPPAITVRRIDTAEIETWVRISAEGWSSAGTAVGAFVEQLGRIVAQARGVACFLAELDGEPIAAAALNLTADVALLAGAATIPSARGRGAQRALLDARLAHASALGIGLAMMVTEPEGTSRRNAERVGFRPVYGRTKWERPADHA